MGSDSVSLTDPAQRSDLFTLLARDDPERFRPCIFCPFCRTFHRPIDGTKTAPPLTLPHSMLKKCQIESPVLKPQNQDWMATFLPQGMRRDMINAVLNSYAHLSPTIGCIDVSICRSQVEIGESTMLLRYAVAIVDHQIMLKTERFILPCRWDDPTKALEAATNFAHSMTRCKPWILELCDHRHMARWLCLLLGNMGPTVTSKESTRCLWAGPAYRIHVEECCCGIIRASQTPSFVLTCEYCDTDISVTFANLPTGPGQIGLRKGATVTTWRRLSSRFPNSEWERDNRLAPSQEINESQSVGMPTTLLKFEGERASITSDKGFVDFDISAQANFTQAQQNTFEYIYIKNPFPRDWIDTGRDGWCIGFAKSVWQSLKLMGVFGRVRARILGKWDKLRDVQEDSDTI
ncbi:hypothetical protein QBC38DRAFT_465333 [Podospora fimiseda]|uniref:Uncharacterized protein n=1 Tax=Podospora fimiseda TaxID=252190 RepID=A0AAN7BY43_9PEZI|nr:hypothetical protein QBC38DRAFT_465333 [Podospora fimiseda]